MIWKAVIALTVGLALIWAVTMWRAVRNERRTLEATPPLGQFLTVNGTRIHYVQAGSGPDLVLIHGASGNLRDWTFDAVNRLSVRYRVTAFDRPGLGYSDRMGKQGASLRSQAEILARASEQLGLQRPIVVGSSYGGAVSLAWAVDHPDTLSGLVLLAAASNPWTTDLSTYYKITSHPVMGPLVIPFLTAWVPNRVVIDTIGQIFAPQSTPDGYAAHIGAGLSLRRESIRENALQRANLLTEIKDLQPDYGKIDVPVEILHGDADTTVYLTVHSVPLSQQLSRAQLTILPGIGHMPHHVAIPEMDRAIDAAAARAGVL